MNQQQRQQLIKAACDVRQRAYAKYSDFQVGAALLAANGKIYSGCNVENASYGLAICAEQVAVSSAVADGQQIFHGLSIASAGGVMPCGACRQVLGEFCEDLSIVIVDTNGGQEPADFGLQQLIPGRFELP